MKHIVTLSIVFGLFLCVVCELFISGDPVLDPLVRSAKGRRTVGGVLAAYGPSVEARLHPYLKEAGISYPPAKVTILAFKEEKRLEIWGKNGQVDWRFIRDYPILAASGTAGPKLRQGDRQVPEGIYRIESLNPNSSYHLSLKINYPNDFDQARAAEEDRTQLGGDIFIHGNNMSIGCLAIGDTAIKEVFVLAAIVGRENVAVVISPRDTRDGTDVSLNPKSPAWIKELYSQIHDALDLFVR